jgi:hypothetical protein
MRTWVFRGSPSIPYPLHFARSYKVTDARDRVYAMLSIPSVAEAWHPLKADCTISELQLFRSVVETSLRNDRSLMSLSFVQHSDGIIRTPSWIPRFDVHERWDVLGKAFTVWRWESNDHENLDACLGRSLATSVVVAGFVLSVQGFVADTVARRVKLDFEALALNANMRESHNDGLCRDSWDKILDLAPQQASEGEKLSITARTLLCCHQDRCELSGVDQIPAVSLADFLAVTCGNGRRTCDGSQRESVFPSSTKTEREMFSFKGAVRT